MKQSSFSHARRKNPTASRSRGLFAGSLLLAACLLATPSEAQTQTEEATEAPGESARKAQRAKGTPLTEAEVVRLAQRWAPDSQVAAASTTLADAREQTSGLFPNPVADWEREAAFAQPRNDQDIFRLTVPIDVARPLSARSLVASESAWTRAEASLERTGAVLRAALAYYEVVALAQQVGILRQALSSLEEASRVLSRREEAGTSSGYESTRLAIARELARSQVAEVAGTLLGARARLAGMLDLDPKALAVATPLTLSTLPSADALVAQIESRRAAADHARAATRSASEAERRAAWAWLPVLALSGGAKIVRAPGTQYGYVVGVSLSLPIFDHGQRFVAEAQAQRSLSEARSEALSRTMRSEVLAAHARYTAARDELQRFDEATSDQIEALLRAARSGYREGERSILELLDAQRARTDVLQRRLALLVAAKRAEARVRAAAGLLR